MGAVYVACTVALTVYGQLAMKWQMSRLDPPPGTSLRERVHFLVRVLLRPWVASALLAGVAAALFWMAALNRFDLTQVYPFTALAFVAVLLLSGLLLGETVTREKVVGVLLVALGIVVGSGPL